MAQPLFFLNGQQIAEQNIGTFKKMKNRKKSNRPKIDQMWN